MNKLLIIILMVITTLTVHAQDSINETINEDIVLEEEDYDDTYTDTVISLRKVVIPADSILKWERSKDFTWINNIDSLLKAQTETPEDRKPVSFLQKVLNSQFLRIMFWLIAASFLIFILYKLFSGSGIFRRKSAKQEIEVNDAVEKIYSQSDYDKLIENSYKAGDLRSAVKFQFLKTLQLLNDRSMIDFAADKTNYQYLREIPAGFRNEFAALVLKYEYTWYGNVIPSEQKYQQYKDDFISFQQRTG